MDSLSYIKERFSHIGQMSDNGASLFALDFGINENLNISNADKIAIGKSVDSFIDKVILHPKSIDENDFSASWDSSSIKASTMLSLNKYGIELNEDSPGIVGLNTITDASNLW